MGQVQLIAGLSERVGQPLPAVGRLDGYLCLVLKLAQQLEEGRGVVGHPPGEHLGALAVDHGDVGTAAV